MAGDSHAAISQKNMAELLLTKPELEAAAPALQALQEHCGPEFVRNLLTGCYVRIRRNKQPCLSRLMGLHIGPEGKQLLWIEGVGQPKSGQVLSQTNPFTDPAEYAKGGRQQLVQCMQELTAAGQVPGIDMTAAGAAVWRKKVLLAWGSHWEEYVAQCGINKLVADLQDTGKMAREATFLEPMPPPQPHPQEQPLPALEQNQQAHQPALPAGAPTEQQPAQQPAVQAPLLSHPQAQQQQAQQQQAQQQPIEPLHGQPLAAQPLQPQMALQVQPGAMQLMQQQGVQVSAVQLPQAPARSGMFEQQQFQQQPLQRALSHQQQPDSPDLPPHLQQSRPAQPVMAPQPMGQLPPREPNVRPETYMQQHLQAPEPLPLAMPPHMQPAGQQPVPAGRAGSWDAPAAEQPRQAVPMRRHPGLAPVAAHPALPPIHMRQHSLPHVPHGRQMAAHNARTGLLPLSISGPARVMDLRCAEQGQLSPRGLSPRMPAGGLPLSQLHAYGLPPGSLHGQVATFFRRFYPSVHSAKVVEAASGVPHHAIIHFGAVWERDAARSRMNGCLFEGWPLTVRLPDEPLALPLQQAQHGPLEFKAYVNGLPPSMDEASVAAFFRRKYPSVLEVRLWPPARDQPAPSVQRGHVFFTEEGERDAAVREMNGQFLEGQKLKVQLPLDEQAALGVQSSRSPQQQRRPRDYSMYVDGLPPNSTDQSVADLFRQRYPSVISARVRPPTTAQLASGSVTSRRAFVNFATQGERDAALEMNGTFVGGQALRVELPWAEQRPLHPAGQPAAAPNGEPAAAPAGPEDRPPLPAGPQFKLFVVNVGNALSADGLYAYFRERYPSVLSAALRDGHGSVTFGSDVERQRAKVEMDGHVLVGGRKIGTGLPEDTAAQPVPDAPAAAAAAAAAPAQPTPPAASAGHAAPPMANGSAQVGAVGGAPTEASPTSALSGPLASAPPQAPALPAGQAGAALPAVEQHQGAAPGAAAAVPAGLAAGQAPAAAAAPQAEAGMSATVAIGQLPAAAAAAAVPAGLGPLQLVGWPAAGMPGGPFVLVPAAAVAAGEGQPQLVAIPDSGASSAGLFHSPSAGMLLPAQQLATAAATAAPAGSSHQHQPGSGIGPSGLQQGSAQAKQESGAGSHPLDGKAEQASKERVGGGSQLCSGRRSSQRRQGHSRSPARHKDRSRSPARRKDRSRSPARHKERSRSPARRKDRSRSPARRKELSRSPPRRKDRSRSPVHHKRRSRSPARRARSRSPVRRARSRSRDRRRSPDERRRRHSSTRRDDRRSHGQDRGASSRQQQHSRERSSKDRKRQFSPHREADARRQRQRTPERAQQATADQRAAKPAAGPPSPGVVTADSPGTRLVVVHRRQRQGTPDVAATPDRAATPDVAAPPDVAATPEPDVQPGTAAAGADIEEVAEEDAGTPDLASFPELAWDAVDVEAEMGAAAEPQQQVQQQVQQQPCGNGTAEEAGPAAGRPSSPTAHVPAEQLWDPQAGSSMDMSASPPPPASPSRPSSAQPPPLPPSRPCSAVPPLPSEPAAVNISPIAVADPGAVGGGIFAGPPGFGLPSAPGGQGWAAPGWAADPDPLGAGGQPHHLHPPAPFLAPPEGPLPLHLRRPDVPSVPAWVCRLFMDAAREMAEARGLPLDVRDVEVRMDRLCRRQFCLREAGVSMADVCRLMEMREQCDLRHTARGLFITALR